MTALLLLIVITSVIGFVQVKTWRIYKNLTFPIVTAVLYFWSLMGAWLFIFDRLTGFGKNIGLAYYYLLDKMFRVDLDGTYNMVILSYGLFILFFQGFVFFGIKRLKQKFPEQALQENGSGKTFTASQVPFLLIAVVSICCSLFLVKDVLISSMLLHESIYSNVRAGGVPLYRLHQYFNWIMVFSFAWYLALYFRKDPEIAVKKPGVLFWICFLLMVTYLSIIGTRHELFLGGLFFILFVSYPYRSVRKSKLFYGVFFIVFFFVIALNDPMRGMSSYLMEKIGIAAMVDSPENRKIADIYSSDRTFFLHRDLEKSERIIESLKYRDTTFVAAGDTIVMKLKEFIAQTKEHPDKILYNGKIYKINNQFVSFGYKKLGLGQRILKAGTNILFSNELFAGHFSMYGIYKHQVSPSYGIALRNLVGSEKQDTYTYYANQLKLPDDQGFTINHISSWYLNFGYFGFILGAFILAICYLVPVYLMHSFKSKKKQTFFILTVLLGMVAYMPLIIRSDLLVFEGMIKQVIIVPALILLAVIIYGRLFQRKK
ncbi:hypothetical protein [uncultured Fluviicola sp.]|uniref:hypothetical protein n=1 Tax=uncultured Fluviicola sp. TaxID=463303 RepID=UPI0025F49FB5|nr:hypothetical protein [uncultured Fluviicola sp.]